nr:hypothetical protein [Brachymonas sp.]
ETTLKLGSAPIAEMRQRINWFVQTIGAVVARHSRSLADVQHADLRYKAGYALRLKGIGTVSDGSAAKNTADKKTAAKGTTEPSTTTKNNAAKNNAPKSTANKPEPKRSM